MRYFAIYDENGKITAIGTGNSGVEISETEYNAILDEIREKNNFVNQLYNDEITIDDVPEVWREEIQKRVDELKEQEEIKLSETELKAQAYDILTGVSE